MHMVGHQHIRVKLALEPLRELAQVMKKILVIRLGKETRLAVIAALDDVDRQTRYRQASTSRHSATNGCLELQDDDRKINPSAY